MSEKATAIEKALEILLIFQTENRPLGTSEISKALGYHKATTSRILLTLVDYGFLSQDINTKKFTLGPKIYELGMRLAETSINKVVTIARPYISTLREKINETIVLEVWSGNRTVVAYAEDSKRSLRVSGPEGNPPPAPHVTAGAKAILAFAEPPEVDRALKGSLERYTQNTVTELEEVKKRLAIYKQQGFATDKEEFEDGIRAIGMPIFDHTGDAIAAIVVLTPSARFTDDAASETLILLKSTTEAISNRLFYKYGQRSLNGNHS